MPRLNPKSSAVSTFFLAILLLAIPALRADSPLEGHMETMEKIYKTLKKQIKDETNRDSSLKLIQEFQLNVLVAKTLTPPGLDKLTPEEKEKAITSYRTLMMNVLRTAIDLEQALLEKNFVQAEEELKTIHDLEDAGHKEFRKEDH